MKLDAKALNLTLPDDKTDKIFWDEELSGFGLRIRAGGNRSWIAQYRADGRTRRPVIGSVEKLTPMEARQAARKILAKAALGHDPQGEKEVKRQQAARTFRSVADAYLAARQSELRPSSLRVTKLYLLGGYFRPLHSIGISNIGHPDIAARLSAIARDHSAITAAAARRAISAMFRWSVEEGWATLNPVIGTRKPADPMPRDRVLSDDELAAVWRACGVDNFGRIVRLLILLGSRRAEIGGMRRSELNLDSGIWTLPKERSKNNHALTITLPPTALTIIRSVQSTQDALFGDHAETGFNSWNIGKRELDRRLADDAVKPWRLHDLRRSVATGMADLGIEPHHIEACLNHFSGHRAGVAGIYNRSSYDRVIAAALARWADHIEELVSGKKRSQVIPITRSAG